MYFAITRTLPTTLFTLSKCNALAGAYLPTTCRPTLFKRTKKGAGGLSRCCIPPRTGLRTRYRDAERFLDNRANEFLRGDRVMWKKKEEGKNVVGSNTNSGVNESVCMCQEKKPAHCGTHVQGDVCIHDTCLVVIVPVGFDGNTGVFL